MKFFGHSGTADDMASLDDLDAQSGTRQISGTGQTIVARANDDDIKLMVAFRGHACYGRPIIQRNARINGNERNRKSDPVQRRITRMPVSRLLEGVTDPQHHCFVE